MSSLWTPSGEHRVPRQDAPGGPAGQPPAAGGGPGEPPPGGPDDLADQPGDGADLSDLTPEEQAQLRDELADLQARLAATPVEDVIANHAYGLFELGALHLSRQPPALPEAKVAIDAFGLLVDGLGERLGAHTKTLRDGLAQIRLAFVQISSATERSQGPDHPAPDQPS